MNLGAFRRAYRWPYQGPPHDGAIPCTPLHSILVVKNVDLGPAELRLPQPKVFKRPLKQIEGRFVNGSLIKVLVAHPEHDLQSPMLILDLASMLCAQYLVEFRSDPLEHALLWMAPPPFVNGQFSEYLPSHVLTPRRFQAVLPCRR